MVGVGLLLRPVAHGWGAGVSGVEWIDRLSDTDLRALSYICGQCETYTEGALPPHAASLSRTIQQEQTRRDQVRRTAAVGRTFISLMAELEVQA